MTMPTAGHNAQKNSGDAAEAPAFVKLWLDSERKEQIRRFDALHLQSCDKEARLVWKQAKSILATMPEGTRVDLPSPRVIARILGLYRTVGSLKHRPVDEIELSVEDIAELLGYSKSTVEAALRWLGDAPIVVRGTLVAKGLGYIKRVRRKARALVEGVIRHVYRTTKTALSEAGRALVGLQSVAKAVRHAFAKAKAVVKQHRVPTEPPATPPGAETRNWDNQLSEIGKIRKQLGR